MPPHTVLFLSLQALVATSSALLTALSRPTTLIASLATTQAAIAKHAQALARGSRAGRGGGSGLGGVWPLALLDDTRAKLQRENEAKLEGARRDEEILSKELAYTREVVAGELAGWQDGRAREGRRVLREFAKGMCVREREVLEGLKRGLREVQMANQARSRLGGEGII